MTTYDNAAFARGISNDRNRFAPLSVRRRVIFFEEVRIPTSLVPYFKRVGRCDDCSNFHFPEYENCAGGWNRPLLRMPAPQVEKIPQAPEPAITPESAKRMEAELQKLFRERRVTRDRDPEPTTRPQRRKFNFDE